jgi:hypothetical protein
MAPRPRLSPLSENKKRLKMPQVIEYAYLLLMMRQVMRDTTDFVANCHCGDCASAKRAKIYFKMFKSCIDDIDKFHNISELLLAEEETFTDTFIMVVLSNVDEDYAMERLFDNKDNMDNNAYLFNCDVLMNVKTFKNMYKDTY